MKNYEIRRLPEAYPALAAIAWKEMAVFLIPLALIALAVLLILLYNRSESAEETDTQDASAGDADFLRAIGGLNSGDFMPYLAQIGKKLENSQEGWSVELLRKYRRAMKMARTEGDNINVAGSEQNTIMHEVVSGYLEHGGRLVVDNSHRKNS